jgi:hypothetical protein
MWDAYKYYSKVGGFEYDDELVMNSITETHNIAFNRIETLFPTQRLNSQTLWFQRDSQMQKLW